MTLLALELRPPPITAITSEPALIAALGDLLPRLVTILMSFLTMGIFWTGQQTQLNHLVRADRDLAWIHIAFLAAVTLTPFTTNLLAPGAIAAFSGTYTGPTNCSSTSTSTCDRSTT